MAERAKIQNRPPMEAAAKVYAIILKRVLDLGWFSMCFDPKRGNNIFDGSEPLIRGGLLHVIDH